MAITAAELEIKIRSSGAREAQRDVESVGQSVEKTGGIFSRVGGVAGGFAKVIGGVGLGAGAGLAALGGIVGKVGFDFNSLQQQSQMAFETILGDSQKARDFMGQIGKFAAQTPFELGPLTQYAARLAAVGTNTADIIPLMTRLGDATAAMGTGSFGIERAVTALTQMQQKGKVTGEEMLQLTEAGIPAWDALAAKLGVDVVKAQEMVTKGQVKANDIFAAIGEGAGPAMQRLEGMMQKQSQTFAGMVSTAKDTFAQFAGTVMGPIFEQATAGLSKLNAAMAQPGFQEFGQRVGQALGQAASAIGQFAAQFGPPLIAAVQQAIPQVIGAIQGFIPQVIAAFQALAPVVVSAFQGIMQTAQTLAPIFVSAFQGVMAAIQPILPVFQQLGQIIAQHMGTIAPIVAVAVAAFMTLTPVVGVITGVIGAITGLGAAITAAGGTVGFIVAILGGPLTIAIAAIAGAIALAVVAWTQNWGDIQGKTEAAVGAIRSAIDGLRGFLQGAGDFLQPLIQRVQEFANTIGPEIDGALNAITSKLSALGSEIQASAENAFSTIAPIVQRVFGEIVGFIQDHSTQIESILRAAWDAIQTIVNTATGIISNAVQAALNIIQGDWSGAWQNLENIVSIWKSGVTELVQSAITIIQNAISIGVDAWKALFTAAWNEIKTSASNAWTEIKTAVSNGINEVESTLRSIPGRAAAAVAGLGNVLFQAGADLIGGLISGIESQIGRLQGVLSSITNMIPNLKGPPMRDRMLLHESGTLIMQGLAGGLAAGFARYVAPMAGQMTDRIPASVSGASGGARIGADGAIKSGWGVVGEAGWEAFHLGPNGLTIFPHETSKALLSGMSGGAAIPGFQRGTMGEVSASIKALIDSIKSDITAAISALKGTSLRHVAEEAIMTLASGPPAGVDPLQWFKDLRRSLERIFFEELQWQAEYKRQYDVIAKFNAEMAKPFSERTAGMQAITRGLYPGIDYHGAGHLRFANGGYIPTPHWLVDQRTGRVTGEMAERGGEWITPDNPNAARGGGGPVYITLNVDGRQFAQIVAPYMSGQFATNIQSTMGAS